MNVKVPSSSLVIAAPAAAPKEVGNYICQRMESIVITAVALHQLAQFTIQHGAHLACAATTILTGLRSIYHGDVWTGGTLTVVGAKEALGLLCSKKTDVQRLLEDASAGIDMIKTLEQANQKSFDNVDANLSVVSQNMENLELRLKDITLLATQGNKALEEQKDKTLHLYTESTTLFEKTQHILKQSRTQIGQSNEQFGKALVRISQLVQLAQQEQGNFPDKAKRFADLSQQIFDECTTAKGTLEKGHQDLNDGLALLNQALATYNAATFEAGKATEMAKAELEKIQQRAQLEISCQGKIQEIREELGEMRDRSNEMRAIANEVQADVNEAKDQASIQFGLQSVILGGGAGAFFGAVFSGGLAAGAGAVGGTVAYHNREALGNVVFGKDPEPIPSFPTILNPVTHKFKEKSTGFWGRYIEKRGSVTAGKVSINIGDKEPLSFKFNLKDPRKSKIIAKKDLFELHKRLSAKLDKDPKYAKDVLHVLNTLETYAIDRSQPHPHKTVHAPVFGFISAQDPFLADLKRRATKKAGKL